jgi:hypothetical protein
LPLPGEPEMTTSPANFMTTRYPYIESSKVTTRELCS